MKPITLPEDKASILSGRHAASGLSENLHAAYWLAGRDDDTALYLLKAAHESLASLADAMGYTLTPKASTDTQEAAE
jgi:hypothetical protein